MTKKNTFKRVMALMLALICVMSSVSVVGVGAVEATKTKTWNHVLSASKYNGNVFYFSVDKKNTYVYDLINGYPSIYDGCNKSKVSYKVYNVKSGKLVYSTTIVLQKDYPAPQTVIRKTLPKGEYRVNYKVISGGGFKVYATLHKKHN